MKLLLVVECNKKVGYGHLVRGIAIASELEKFGWIWDIYANDNQMFNAKFIKLDNKKIIKDLNDEIHTNKKCNIINYDLTIIDGYNFKNKFISKLKTISKKLMIIDDLAEKKRDCDYLLDMSPNRTHFDYQKLVSKKTKLLIGKKYLIIKNQFLKSKIFNCNKNKQKRYPNILLSMGSTDPQNLTFIILKYLVSLKNNYKIKVVISSKSEYLKEIKKLGVWKKKFVKIFVDQNDIQLQKIYAETDICFGSAGISIWERIFFNIPNIIINPNSFQLHLSDFLVNNNIVKVIQFSTRHLSNRNKMLINIFLKHQHLKTKMIKFGSKLVDGKGLENIINFINNETF